MEEFFREKSRHEILFRIKDIGVFMIYGVREIYGVEATHTLEHNYLLTTYLIIIIML